MLRVMLLLGIGCLVVVCSVGIWRAFQPPIQLLVSPDATDIRVTDTSWGEWTLTYRTPSLPYSWYTTVVHQLETNGWTLGERYTGGPLYDPPTYTQMLSFGFVALWEQVNLDGDLQGAHIRIHRWITIQPLNQLSGLVSHFLFERLRSGRVAAHGIWLIR
jgi:hypothetical protein